MYADGVLQRHYDVTGPEPLSYTCRSPVPSSIGMESPQPQDAPQSSATRSAGIVHRLPVLIGKNPRCGLRQLRPRSAQDHRTERARRSQSRRYVPRVLASPRAGRSGPRERPRCRRAMTSAMGSPAARRGRWMTCLARSRQPWQLLNGGSDMNESAGRTRAAAVITVHKYEPSAYDEPAEGPVLTRIHVEESFSGDITGDGIVEFLQGHAPMDRRASWASNGSPASSAGGAAHSCSRTLAQCRTASSAGLVCDPRVGHRQLAAARRRRLPRQPRRIAEVHLDSWFE